jgi:hypothetical protein
VLATVFFPTRVSVWHAIGISDMVLIEADRIDTLGKKTATVRIDKPEHPVRFVDTKKAASAEAIIDDSAPFGSTQENLPTADQQNLFIAPVGRELLIYLKIIAQIGRTINITSPSAWAEG